ncbi:DUF4859 domain-containing protein [Roseimarinus sediminis]|uniref:DUF4859 domain-containing protein n=1 Tax=Roseimarinus sediminis TaxID=1610899 RepID=UPI003D2014BA
MKSILSYIFMAMLIMGMIACGENEDFSNPHQLTAEQQAELDRQDSIEEAQRNRIDADLVLRYEAQITISQTVYDGTSVTIETDKIAELFGISEADLLLGIAGESGAPEVKGFAIEGSTRADVGSATNTNSPWGHWWDINGDITVWGDDAMVFAEFNTETGVFAVGQYPGHLVENDTITFIEALKYNDLRAAVVISVITQAPGAFVDPETPPAGDPEDVTIDVQLSKELTSDYASVTFDVREHLRNAFKMTTYQIHNAILDGTLKLYVGEVSADDPAYSADVPGYWLNSDGSAGQWAEGWVWISIGHSEDELYLFGGNHPDNAQAGNTINTTYIATCNGGSLTLNISFELKADEYVDPETAPAGDPEALTLDVTLSKAYSNDYASVTADVKETLRNAFKMTTYQIDQAIAAGDLKLYQGEVTDSDPVYTADAPGFWLKADGTAGEWAEGVVWCSLGHNKEELFLYGGNHPDNATAGMSLVSVLTATCNGGSVTINLTFNVE